MLIFSISQSSYETHDRFGFGHGILAQPFEPGRQPANRSTPLPANDFGSTILLMFATKSVARRPLSMQPSAPAAATVVLNSIGSYWLIIRTLVWGSSMRRRRTASNPLRMGILMSITTRSGESSRAFLSTSEL